MLQLLSILTIITVVYCDSKCPAYSAYDLYPHRRDMESKIIGDYYTVFTTGLVVNCGRVQCSRNINNAVICHIKSPGCCARQENFVFGPNGANYTIGPEPGYSESCPYLISEEGSSKLLGVYGSEERQCLVIAVCQGAYNAMNVACRNKEPPLLVDLLAFLTNVLGLLNLTEAMTLQSVSQTNCVLPSDTCPGLA